MKKKTLKYKYKECVIIVQHCYYYLNNEDQQSTFIRDKQVNLGAKTYIFNKRYLLPPPSHF